MCFKSYFQVRQISAQKPVQDQLLQSFKSSQRAIEQLKLDNDEVCHFMSFGLHTHVDRVDKDYS